MSIVEVNWNPSSKQLRQFGVICLFALPMIAWFWGASTNFILVLAAIGMVIALASMFLPQLVKPLFLGLMLVTAPIGMIIGEFAMLLIYVLTIIPIGLIFRLTGRDALQGRLDRNAQTYWKNKKQPASAKHYYRQF